jgi:hypothetical protein
MKKRVAKSKKETRSRFDGKVCGAANVDMHWALQFDLLGWRRQNSCPDRQTERGFVEQVREHHVSEGILSFTRVFVKPP